MPTPNKVYVKQTPEERRIKRAEGMRRYREMYPERVTASDRKHYEKNRANRIARVAKWVSSNPEKVLTNSRKCHLKLNYGMTVNEWNEMFDGQDRICAICKTDSSGYGGKKHQWDTDHDHTTGKVRGILCHQCNVMLGASRDEISTLLSAIDYLIDNP
jgi:hypothetical protein